jgi:CRISP-associated protein Cas1
MTLHVNTLFVTTEGAWVHKEHETVVVSVNKERRAQVPMLHLAAVACFGRVMVSPELMAALAEAGIHMAFFSATGRFRARVEGMPGGSVVLRRLQHRAADNGDKSLALARSFVIGKIANSRQFVLHARRDAPSAERKERLDGAAERMALLLRQAAAVDAIDSLRGVEGAAAKEYFEVFNDLVKRSEEVFAFRSRSRHPPRDRINALLSFGYALLMHDCTAALAGVGLDPAIGFLHEDRPGRLSLALDLMEELRAPIVDRMVVSLVNRGQITADDVHEEPAGTWRLTEAGRKQFLISYQEAKQAMIQHAFLDQETPWGRVAHLQALLLARTLRGDLDAYPPFSVR